MSACRATGLSGEGWVKATGRDPTGLVVPWTLGRAALDPTYVHSALAVTDHSTTRSPDAPDRGGVAAIEAFEGVEHEEAIVHGERAFDETIPTFEDGRR